MSSAGATAFEAELACGPHVALVKPQSRAALRASGAADALAEALVRSLLAELCPARHAKRAKPDRAREDAGER